VLFRSRLSDPRTPTAHAASHGTGGADALTIAPAQVTGTAVVDNDARLSNARTPTAHKSTHATGGTDALTAADIGAAPADDWNPVNLHAVDSSRSSNWQAFTASATYGPATRTNTQSSGWLEWDITLAAGTFTIDLICFRNPDAGIATLSLDGTTVGTLDLYVAIGNPAVLSLANVVVATGGKKVFRIASGTKNPSSSGFFIRYAASIIRRTA
jgi:hypothetical protein